MVSITVEKMVNYRWMSIVLVLATSFFIVLISWVVCYYFFLKYKPDFTTENQDIEMEQRMDQDTRKDIIDLLKKGKEDETDKNESSGRVKNKRRFYYGIKLDDLDVHSRTEQSIHGIKLDDVDVHSRTEQCIHGIKLDDVDVHSRTEQWFLIDKKTVTELRSKESPSVSNYSLMLVDNSIFSKYTQRDTENYVWLIIMMGVFYTLPVIQLVFAHQENVVNTGDTNNFNFGINFQRKFCKKGVFA